MAVIVPFSPDMATLGESVVAIGVFDGVHRGHQEILGATVRDAVMRGARAVALTFDRDPDQVLDAATAAPQLLSLDDKVTFIGETGIEAVLVVPFTPEVAALSPPDFLATIVSVALDPVAVHVGHDFRFGARAAGDVDDLHLWAVTRGIDVAPHRLCEVDGAPVTSTRIRRAVAEGDVAEAERLLGRPTRVTGQVVRGRGAGRDLGVPTANVTPSPYAALPADGVYAGTAEVPEGIFAAAISVGTPPMFPEARDYLEAHLIDFEGDLYGEVVTLSFLERLRAQKRYEGLDELVRAIGKDVRETDAVVRARAGRSLRDEGLMPDGSRVVDDPDALLAAEQAVRSADPFETAWEVGATASWVPVLTSERYLLSERLGPMTRLMRAWTVLADAGVPTGWDPYPPGSEAAHPPGIRLKPISLLVPEEYADQATALLAQDAADHGDAP